MEWKISYTVPEQHIIIEADNEIEADETARKVIDGITIEKSFSSGGFSSYLKVFFRSKS